MIVEMMWKHLKKVWDELWRVSIGFICYFAKQLSLLHMNWINNAKISELKPSVNGPAILFEFRDLIVNSEPLFLEFFP